ncbi:hypothetical protein [Paraburkholderia sp. GAS32]|uniref:hypothetical protein n=1 Tax=Paraburkholderia sp. GAS32 TaxID=3035129 RepID=UPI003D24ABD3
MHRRHKKNNASTIRLVNRGECLARLCLRLTRIRKTIDSENLRGGTRRIIAQSNEQSSRIFPEKFIVKVLQRM